MLKLLGDSPQSSSKTLREGGERRMNLDVNLLGPPGHHHTSRQGQAASELLVEICHDSH